MSGQSVASQCAAAMCSIRLTLNILALLFNRKGHLQQVSRITAGLDEQFGKEVKYDTPDVPGFPSVLAQTHACLEVRREYLDHAAFVLTAAYVDTTSR